jgi:hypothetical protein|nr:MAG: hypothetical protein [Bacteriophage sp.]
MSYQKIKTMIIKEDKDGNVHIKMTVASNNIIPLNYVKYEGTRTWEQFFYNLLGEDWQPNDSANKYFWKALMTIFFGMIKRNGDDTTQIWLGYHLEDEATKEQKELFEKYLKKFKELYYRLKSLSSLPYKFAVWDDNKGYTVKMTSNRVWRSFYECKQYSLCEAFVVWYKLKEYYSAHNAVISPIVSSSNNGNDRIKDFLTQIIS